MPRSPLILLVLVAALGATGTASAQVDAQIADLNSQALEAYQALDIDKARGKLEQAIGLAQQSGLGGPPVAQTFMNLGVVYVAGVNDRDQGLTAFLSAVCIQPDVQLDPLLSTPDVQQVFTQAQHDAQSGACGPGAAPAPGGGMPPQGYASPAMAAQSGYGGPRMDQECPPGVKCDTTGSEAAGPTDFKRGFVDLQLAYGLAMVRQGMKADSKPKNWMTEVFNPTEVRQVDANGDGVIDMKDVNPMTGAIDTVDRHFFHTSGGVMPVLDSAWIPDADSFDDFENAAAMIPRGRTPASTSCKADGKPSGPLDLKDLSGKPFTTLEPSSYCVRVEKPGLVPNLALRLTPGYFVSKRFALAVPFRFQFAAGQSSMAHIVIGLRGELLLTKTDKATGVPVSWFFGAMYGQIQAKPPPRDPARPAPYVISGPFGLNTGVNVRIRVHRNFGFIVSPELDLLVPNLLFNIDLAAGVEGAF